jgi:hypothetical protein
VLAVVKRPVALRLRLENQKYAYINDDFMGILLMVNNNSSDLWLNPSTHRLCEHRSDILQW